MTRNEYRCSVKTSEILPLLREVFGRSLNPSSLEVEAALGSMFVPGVIPVVTPETALQAWEYFRAHLAPKNPRLYQCWARPQHPKSLSDVSVPRGGALPLLFKLDAAWEAAHPRPCKSGLGPDPLPERLCGGWTPPPSRSRQVPTLRAFQARFPQLSLLLMSDIRLATRVQVDLSTGWVLSLTSQRSWRGDRPVNQGRHDWGQLLSKAVVNFAEERLGEAPLEARALLTKIREAGSALHVRPSGHVEAVSPHDPVYGVHLSHGAKGLLQDLATLPYSAHAELGILRHLDALLGLPPEVHVPLPWPLSWAGPPDFQIWE